MNQKEYIDKIRKIDGKSSEQFASVNAKLMCVMHSRPDIETLWQKRLK